VRGSAVGKKVLVIDDSSTVRSYYRKILEANGFAVAEAINAYEGIEKALEEEFDLYLVDINMTKGTGIDFLREVRSNPELVAVPAAVISTESEEKDVELSLSAGANVHFIKPLKPETLLEICRILTGEVAADG